MAAHQDPLSLGFSRQEHWSRLPFPSPVHENENEREVTQSCPTPSDLMDCSLPGSSIHGIFQARVLEWGAIAFSKTVPTEHFKTLMTYWSWKKYLISWRNRFYINIMYQIYSCLKSYHIKSQRVGNLKVQFKINHGLKKTSQGKINKYFAWKN